MLYIPLLIGFVLHCVLGFIAAWLFRSLRECKGYAVAWSVIICASLAWLTYFFTINGNMVPQLLGDVLAHPNEDVWALNIIGLCILFVYTAPIPIVIAGLWVHPSTRWWAYVICACPVVAVVMLYLTKHGTCELSIRDQFGVPVCNAQVTYYKGGRTTKTSDKNGIVHIPFFRPQRLSIVDVDAGGYVVDYRMCSHKPYEPIPQKATLPAWKIVSAPKLLLSRPSIPVITDGRPYFINLVRGKASVDPLPNTDIEVRVDAPLEVSHQPGPGRGRLEPFPWTVRINIVNGGLQVAPPGYRYLAPTKGYVSSFAKTLDPKVSGWNSSFGETFYLRLRDGKVYAVAQITVTTLEESARRIFVDASVNPTADESLFSGNGISAYSPSDIKSWLTALLGENY